MLNQLPNLYQANTLVLRLILSSQADIKGNLAYLCGIKMIQLHVWFFITCFFQGGLSEMIECIHQHDCIDELTYLQIEDVEV